MTGGEETFVEGHSYASRSRGGPGFSAVKARGSNEESINFDRSGEYGGFATKLRRYIFLKGDADGSGSGGGPVFAAEGGGGECRRRPCKFVGHIRVEGEASESCGVRGNFTEFCCRIPGEGSMGEEEVKLVLARDGRQLWKTLVIAIR